MQMKQKIGSYTNTCILNCREHRSIRMLWAVKAEILQ